MRILITFLIGTCLAFAEKPVLKGLVATSGLPPVGWEEIIKFAVCPVRWQDIEPAPGEYNFAKIDQFLQEAEKRNVGVYVRMFAGRQAPDWLKKKAGAARVTDRFDSITADVVRWWQPEVGKAYYDLQKALAARYDRNPRFIAITMTRCSSIWAEPLMRQINDKATRDALWDAGLRPDIDKTCQLETVKMHAEIWKQTYSTLAVNPYQEIDESAKGWHANVDYTIELIKQAKSILGGRLLIQNNSLKDNLPPPQSDYGRMMEAMRQSGAILGFQTVGNSRIKELKTTIEAGIQAGASYFEVYGEDKQNNVNHATKADFAELSERLGKSR